MQTCLYKVENMILALILKLRLTVLLMNGSQKHGHCFKKYLFKEIFLLELFLHLAKKKVLLHQHL